MSDSIDAVQNALWKRLGRKLLILHFNCDVDKDNIVTCFTAAVVPRNVCRCFVLLLFQFCLQMSSYSSLIKPLTARNVTKQSHVQIFFLKVFICQ